MTTPMMQQWNACKESAKSALLLFRLGDFYEAFYDDAVKLSEALEVTLTKRQEIPMAGIPVHTLDNYLEKLIAKKMIVAIAEQVENPKEVKGIVKREVTQIISPATYVPGQMSEDGNNNFFASIGQINSTLGLVLLDMSTSELKVMEMEDLSSLFDEVVKHKPTELVVSTKFAKSHPQFMDQIHLACSLRFEILNNHTFDFENSLALLTAHFQTQSLDGYGLKGFVAATCAMGALFNHIQNDLHLNLDHITSIQRESLTSYMMVDHTTMNHLELLQSPGTSLFDLLDQTKTAMGRRLFKSWITHPLIAVEKICARQDGVEELTHQSATLQLIGKLLKHIRDLERLGMRIQSGRINPKEMIAFQTSLLTIPEMKLALSEFHSPLMVELNNSLEVMEQVTDAIGQAISDDPPVKLANGGAIRAGYNDELDNLRALKRGSQQFLSDYQERLREELNVRSLKVSFTRAFGYYIEVSKMQAERMPETFERRQTLVNSQRFISQELKEFESKILNAEAQIEMLEQNLYTNLIEVLKELTFNLTKTARAIAQIDCLQSLATAALENGYVKPTIDMSDRLDIVEGRHPIIEKSLLDGTFIPNDTNLHAQEKMMVITGPNMAGKSTYIRQVALITLMAQMGSFVPAQSAHIGMIERLFTRIGASDDLSRGLSTFMVEMSETASILNQCNERSLIILDEIGRGTSTYDGIAIAWSVAEHLITPLERAPKTLFATHYFELTEIDQELAGVQNYRIAVKEAEDEVVFLRKIVKGAADKSYGIHVAKLAGIPHSVIHKAQERLTSLERQPEPKAAPKQPEGQLSLFGSADTTPIKNNVMNQLCTLDLDETTPREALDQLSKFQKMLKDV